MFITPGVKNCIRCSLESFGQVTWQVTLPGMLFTVDVGPSTPFAEVDNNILVLAEPEEYVLPGQLGAKEIVCNGGGQQIATFLASPGVSYSTKIHCCTAWAYKVPSCMNIRRTYTHTLIQFKACRWGMVYIPCANMHAYTPIQF